MKWVKELLPLLAVLVIAGASFFLKPSAAGPDVTNYLNTGRRLMHGESYIPAPESADYGKSSDRAPLYPILFAISFRLFDLSVSSAFLVPQLAAFGSFVLIYLLLRRIYDIETGLAAVALMATNFYITTFPTTFNIDLAMSFVIYLGLFFIVLAIGKPNLIFAVLAGITMGIAVLIKELSLLWLPMMVYLFLGTRSYEKQNFSTILGYGLGSGTAAGFWWVFYYYQTGSIFLFDAIPVNVINFIRITLILCALVLPVSVLLYKFRYKFLNMHWFQSFSTYFPRYLYVFNWLLWIIVTVILTIVLSSKTPLRFDTNPEIVYRLTNFYSYLKYSILPNHPLFQYLPIAIALIIISAFFTKSPGNSFLLWMLLASAPMILTAYLPDIYRMPVRYFLPVYLLGYLTLGRGLIVVLEGMNVIVTKVISYFYVNRPVNLHLSSLSLLILLPYAWQTSWKTSSSYTYNLRSTDNYLSDYVLEVSEWLEKNAPVGSNIVTAGSFHTGYRFFTDGKFNFYRWESFNENLGDTKWAVETQVSLEKTPYGLQLLSKRGNAYTLPIQKPLYIEFVFDLQVVGGKDSEGTNVAGQAELVPRFFTISEENLIDYLKRYKIDYIVLPESSFSHSRLLEGIPSYFKDSPAFEQLLVSKWTEGNESYAIHVYKVNKDQLDVYGYPSVIDLKAWKSLEKRARVLLGDQYDVYLLSQALGNGPIILNPASPDNTAIYKELAHAYLVHNNIELAVFQYHLALATTSLSADSVQRFVNDLIASYPDYSGIGLLSGDIYSLQHQIGLAEEAYKQALTEPNQSEIFYAEVYRLLAELYFSKGQFDKAVENYQLAVKSHIFRVTDIQKNYLIAMSRFYENQRMLDQAVAVYKQFLEIEFKDIVSTPKDDTKTNYYDFIKKLDEARITTENSQDIYPRVTNNKDQIIKYIYMHPNTEIEYSVTVPENANIEFAPYISPEVWQLGKGDGVRFTVYLSTQDNAKYVLYDDYWDPKNVTDQRKLIFESIDLSIWANQSVRITFGTTCGPNNDCRFDWAGWAEPKITQTIFYDFLANYSKAVKDTLGTQTGQIEVHTQAIDNDSRLILYQHPSSRVTYAVSLPQKASLQFGIGMSQEAWMRGRTDGVEYNIYVRILNKPDTLYRVYTRGLNPLNNPNDRQWFDERVDLSQFGGEAIELIFESLPGPSGSFDFDWGGWSSPVLIDETDPGLLGAQSLHAVP